LKTLKFKIAIVPCGIKTLYSLVYNEPRALASKKSF